MNNMFLFDCLDGSFYLSVYVIVVILWLKVALMFHGIDSSIDKHVCV